MDISGYSKFGGILIETKLAETLQDEYDGQFPDFDADMKANRAADIAYLDRCVKNEKAAFAAEKVSADISAAWVDPLANYHGPKHQLFRNDALDKLANSLESSGAEGHQIASTKAMILKLVKSGEYRKLRQLPRSYRRDLHVMREKFPNFMEVINYVSTCAELANRSYDRVMRINPILLHGGPGTGKSMFAEYLACWIDAGSIVIDIASATNNASLAGSSSFWSNGRAGKLFELLCSSSQSDHANPVIQIEEIDKCSASNYDPLGPLYTLLQPSTSAKFIDAFYDLEIDASAVTYIATANDISNLNPALLSRFRTFEISITPEESKAVSLLIARDALDDLRPATDDMDISIEVIDMVSMMSPRRVKQLMTEAIGKAMARDGNIVTIDDLPASTQTRRRMGFLS